MKVQNEFKMSLLSRSANESFSRVAVASFFAQLDPTVEELADIKTAVSEAVTNCIVHAYKEKLGTVYIHAKILQDDTVYVRIKDRGCGIEDVETAMQPLYSTVGGERAGLGFSVMQSFMDKLKVTSTVGKGTTVTFWKRLSSRERE